MPQSASLKWMAIATFIFLILCENYKSIDSVINKFRDTSVNRMMTTNSHEENVNHLDHESYRQPDGCDFSKFVQRFKPEELEINCSNIHMIKIGRYVFRCHDLVRYSIILITN